MCTLTVLREPARLTITMNRDDSGTRLEAPPALWKAEPRFAAPKDLQAGGTWIGVNALGLTACLLNRYDAAPAGQTSRGSIVLEAMREGTPEAAAARLTSLTLSSFSPFTCLLINLDHGVRLDWNGHAVSRMALDTHGALMLTSSSWRYDEVQQQRAKLFDSIWAQPDANKDQLADFHCRRDEAHQRWMPMMQREVSETKSITQVTLAQEGATMRYWTRASAITRQLSDPDKEIRLSREHRFATV